MASVDLPSDFESVDTDNLVDLIADMCQRLMNHNDRIPLSPESLTRFHSRSPPNISVQDYLQRIVKYTNVEKSCLLLMLHYIDQICARTPSFTLSSLTCHRFLIASIAVSSKGFCDAFCTNAHYAKVGGITVAELNILEREFLSMINWRLMSTREVLQEYYINLVRTHTSGRYRLAHRPSAASPSSEDESSYGSSMSEADDDDDDFMNSPPPEGPPQQPTATGTLLADRTILASPAPRGGATFEQNMAFRALRESHRGEAPYPQQELQQQADHPERGQDSSHEYGGRQ